MIKRYFLDKIIFSLLFLLSVFSNAQQGKAGNWLMYFGMNKLNDKFSLYTEVQYRNYTLVTNNTEQLLLRTGLNDHFSNNTFVTVGYANIPSYIFESEQQTPETEVHRIWQQFILTTKINRIKFEHRYRIEQRC